jgi:hypothetical protein
MGWVQGIARTSVCDEALPVARAGALTDRSRQASSSTTINAATPSHLRMHPSLNRMDDRARLARQAIAVATSERGSGEPGGHSRGMGPT